MLWHVATRNMSPNAFKVLQDVTRSRTLAVRFLVAQRTAKQSAVKRPRPGQGLRAQRVGRKMFHGLKMP